MKVSVGLIVLLCACVVRAEDTPAYTRLKKVAAEMAKFGMPVDVTKVRFTVKEPTREEFFGGLSGFDLSNSGRTRVPLGEYRPAERAIHVSACGNLAWSAGDALAAHELAHAFQYQRDPSLQSADLPTTEERMIQTCMLEGEATLASLMLLLSRRGVGLGDVDFSAADLGSRMGCTTRGKNVSYIAGFRFMGERAKQHGVIQLAKVSASPPASTEQILHPVKLGRDRPTPIRFPPLPKAELKEEDTLGELHLQSEFSSRLKPIDAVRAAIGWDGDRIRRYTTDSGEKFTVWITVWDRLIDAMQAETAIRKSWRRGTTLRRGRTVSWVASTDKVLRGQLVATMRGWDCSGELDVAGARSTTVAEEEAMRLCAQAHRLRDGRWFLPEVGVSIPVPQGWKLHLGQQVQLRKTLKNAVLAVGFDSWPMAAFGDIERLAEHLRRPPQPLYWIRPVSIERIERDGVVALRARRRPLWGRRDMPCEFIELYVPRGGTLVRFMMITFHRSWAQTRERESMLRAFADLRVERD